MNAMNAMGTLTYRHQRQSRYSVSRPPASSPIAAPAPTIAPNTPKALPRSLGSVNVVVSSDSAAGASSAANTPWRARAPNSIPEFTAAPPSADAAAKPNRPIMKVSLRPARSATRPPSSSSPPKASV